MKTDLAPKNLIRERGLILDSDDARGANRTLRILTAHFGVIRAAAYGSGKLNSPLTGATQLFTLSDFDFVVRRGFYRVEAATCVRQYPAITQDITRFSLAAFFSEVLFDIAPAGTSDEEIFSCTLAAFSALENPKRNPELIRAAFTLRTLHESGYALDLSSDAGRFDPVYGSTGGSGTPIPAGVLAALRYIASAPYSRLFSFTLGEESTAVLAGLSEQYLRIQADRDYPTLAYYHRIRTFSHNVN